MMVEKKGRQDSIVYEKREGKGGREETRRKRKGEMRREEESRNREKRGREEEEKGKGERTEKKMR